MLGAAFLSVAVPVVLVGLDMGGELTLAIFAPGLLVMSPVHNILPALIVTLLVDAIVYCAVAYFVVWSIFRLMHINPQPEWVANHDAEQIVGREAR